MARYEMTSRIAKAGVAAADVVELAESICKGSTYVYGDSVYAESNRGFDAVMAAIDTLSKRTAPATIAAPAEKVAFGAPHRCAFCGGTWAVTKVYDMSGLPGYVCGHHSGDFAEGLGSFC